MTPILRLTTLIVTTIFSSAIFESFASKRSNNCKELAQIKAARLNNMTGDFVKLGWHEDKTASLGGQVKLNCDHIGFKEGDPTYSPPVDLLWFKDDKRLVNSDRITISGCSKSPFIMGTKLVINDVRKKDSGEYFCKLYPKGVITEETPLVIERISVNISIIGITGKEIHIQDTIAKWIPFTPLPVLGGIVLLLCVCSCKFDYMKEKASTCCISLENKINYFQDRKRTVSTSQNIPVEYRCHETKSLVEVVEDEAENNMETIIKTFRGAFPFLTSQDVKDLSKFEIQRQRLQCNMHHSVPILLGTGNFGQVYAGTVELSVGSLTPVAVKQLNDGQTAEEIGNFIREVVTLMRAGNHINVISLVATVVLDTLAKEELDNSEIRVQRPPILVMELANGGNLRKYLLDNRENFSHGKDTHSNWSTHEANQSNLTMRTLISFGYQVSRGMQHLSSRKILHRDLAARNILLTDRLEIKIADFGLSKFIQNEKDYYKISHQGITPAKWTAPESLWTSKFTVKSDVWSYGVLLWEILTLGGQPYVGIPTYKLYEFLYAGNRLQRPNLATFEIHELMLTCWAWEPELRPDFITLMNEMRKILLSQSSQIVNPFISKCCIFKGSEKDSGMSCCSSSMTDSTLESQVDRNCSISSFGSMDSIGTMIPMGPATPSDSTPSVLYEIMNPLYEPHSSGIDHKPHESSDSVKKGTALICKEGREETLCSKHIR